MQHSVRSIALASCAVLLVACGGTKTTTKKPKEDPKPEPAKQVGEQLRFKAKQNDRLNAKVALTMEFDVMVKQGKKTTPKKISLSFNLASEEKIDSVDNLGNMALTARLADAIGKAQGMDAKTVDDFALAIDELKINLTRTPRGDITSVGINGVRAPLDDRVARAIVNALYSASRGPLLPEDAVDVNGTWKSELQVPLGPNAIGNAVYNYTFAKKDGAIAVLSSTGSVTGEAGPGKKVTGTITSEYKLDSVQGKLTTYSTDINSTVEDASAPADARTSGQRIKVELTYGP